jgi:glyceraldehyde 3-phosphate dehydrogenase
VHDLFEIQSALMTTIHSYTNDQRILDLPHKDLRRARAAALSMIPTTTGAAKAVALVIPDLKGKFDGFAVRVPTPTVSLVDFVAQVRRKPDAEKLRKAFEKAKKGRMKGILDISYEPLVSADYQGSGFSSVIDWELCSIMGNLVKIVTWYDNEWGYSTRCADLVKYIGDRMM